MKVKRDYELTNFAEKGISQEDILETLRRASDLITEYRG